MNRIFHNSLCEPKNWNRRIIGSDRGNKFHSGGGTQIHSGRNPDKNRQTGKGN